MQFQQKFTQRIPAGGMLRIMYKYMAAGHIIKVFVVTVNTIV